MTGSRLRVAARAPCPRPLIDTPFVPSCPLRQADWQIDALTTPFESSRPGGLGAAPLCESRNTLALNSMRSSRAANCRLWARRSPLRIRSFPFIFDRPRANLRSGVLGPGSWVLGLGSATSARVGRRLVCVCFCERRRRRTRQRRDLGVRARRGHGTALHCTIGARRSIPQAPDRNAAPVPETRQWATSRTVFPVRRCPTTRTQRRHVSLPLCLLCALTRVAASTATSRMRRRDWRDWMLEPKGTRWKTAPAGTPEEAKFFWCAAWTT